MPNTIEHIRANVTAKAGALRARAQGFTGVFGQLVAQHAEIAELLERAGRTRDEQERGELWVAVRRELLSHERAELAVVYEELAKYAATSDIAESHADEAPTLEALIAEIDVVGYDAPSFGPLLARLVRLVQQHVDEEENDFFPRAEDELGEDVARELRAPFEAAQERQLETLA
jgi:hypothetical protein